jgi:hypothetical protein
MKQCYGCDKIKGLNNFYKNAASSDGHMSRCIDCIKEYQQAKKAAEDALRPAGWKQKTKDKASYQKEWTAANPGYMTLKKKEWWQKNRERLKIKDAVRYAVKTGKLVKLPCIECGELKVEAHHPNYENALDVVWLCRKHHNEIHNVWAKQCE